MLAAVSWHFDEAEVRNCEKVWLRVLSIFCRVCELVGQSDCLSFLHFLNSVDVDYFGFLVWYCALLYSNEISMLVEGEDSRKENREVEVYMGVPEMLRDDA